MLKSQKFNNFSIVYRKHEKSIAILPPCVHNDAKAGCYFLGKRGERNARENEGISESQIATGTSVTGETTTVSEARLAPLLRVDQASSEDETDCEAAAQPQSSTTASTASKFIRNGSELRRSLRRINSLTRRKLSPSSTSVAKSPKSPRKHSQGSITNDFVSHV